jgi:hypothetical protein
MKRLCHGMVLALLLATRSAAAPPTEPAKPDAAPAEVVAVFQDGTTIRKAVLTESIEVATKYGKLTVPAADVRRIEFGRHVSEETERKIEGLVKQLGSDEFRLREAASKELVAVGAAAVQHLEAAGKGPDKETSTRAKAALERIRAAVPEELLVMKADDVIRTRDGGVLIGRVANAALKAQTDNFGEMTFKLANLRFIQSSAREEVEVTVEAAAFHEDPEKWFDSGLVVAGQTDLVVAASGQVELVPQTPGQAVAGPDGYGGGGRTGPFAYGTLVGRIGEKGEPFVLGTHYADRAPAEGRLYLQIVPIVGNMPQVPGGSYKVKITAGFDLVPEKKRPPDGGGSRAGVGPFPQGRPPAVWINPPQAPVPPPATVPVPVLPQVGR